MKSSATPYSNCGTNYSPARAGQHKRLRRSALRWHLGCRCAAFERVLKTRTESGCSGSDEVRSLPWVGKNIQVPGFGARASGNTFDRLSLPPKVSSTVQHQRAALRRIAQIGARSALPCNRSENDAPRMAAEVSKVGTTAPLNRSELYLELLPMKTSGQCELLDNKRLVAQLTFQRAGCSVGYIIVSGRWMVYRVVSGRSRGTPLKVHGLVRGHRVRLPTAEELAELLGRDRRHDDGTHRGHGRDVQRQALRLRTSVLRVRRGPCDLLTMREILARRGGSATATRPTRWGLRSLPALWIFTYRTHPDRRRAAKKTETA